MLACVHLATEDDKTSVDRILEHLLDSVDFEGLTVCIDVASLVQHVGDLCGAVLAGRIELAGAQHGRTTIILDEQSIPAVVADGHWANVPSLLYRLEGVFEICLTINSSTS